MALGVSGLMSGLDTESIVTQMMQLERRPIVLLQQQEAAYQARISAIGILKGGLGELQSAAKALKEPTLFSGYTATSANTTVLSASASSTALGGDHQVTVNALAKAQKVRSAAFTGSDQVVGTGTLSIQVGANAAVDVTIDSTNNTVAGIAQAINNAATDVTAGVLNDGLGNYYLTLTSKETGSSNTITMTMVDDDGVNNDAAGLSRIYDAPATQAMFQTVAAGNALLNVDGIDVERSKNTIDDLITGVTLTLKTADPGNPFNVSITRNVSGITSKIQAFVDKFNSTTSLLKSQLASDPDKGSIGALQGDSTPRILQLRLKSLLYAQVGGVASEVNSLSALGVTAGKDGKLTFDSTVFTAAYETNREDVTNFFTQTTVGSVGIAGQFDSFLDSYLKSSGLLAAKEEGMNKSIENIGDQVERIEFRLLKREENLRRQFNSLESLLAQFQNTSGVLSQQLEGLSNLSSQISKGN